MVRDHHSWTKYFQRYELLDLGLDLWIGHEDRVTGTEAVVLGDLGITSLYAISLSPVHYSVVVEPKAPFNAKSWLVRDLAARRGFEPLLNVPKTSVLPLDDRANRS